MWTDVNPSDTSGECKEFIDSHTVVSPPYIRDGKMSLVHRRPGCFVLHAGRPGWVVRVWAVEGQVGDGWTSAGVPYWHWWRSEPPSLNNFVGRRAQLRARDVWSAPAGRILRSSKCQTFWRLYDSFRQAGFLPPSLAGYYRPPMCPATSRSLLPHNFARVNK